MHVESIIKFNNLPQVLQKLWPLKKNSISCLIGLDILPSYAKLLELSYINGKYTVEGFGLARFPSEAIVGNTIKKPEIVASILRETHNGIPCKTSFAALAVPGNAVAIKKIQLSKDLQETELETQIWLEAGKHFSELIDDISLDFYEQERQDENTELKDILLVACRKANIENTCNTLESAGFDPKVVDINHYALARALCFINQQQLKIDAMDAVALIDMSLEISTLVVVQGNQLLFSHTDEFVGHEVLEQAKNILKIDDWLIELKKNSANLDQVEHENLKKSVANFIIPHISQELNTYYSTNKLPQIKYLVLSGEVAMIPNLAKWVQDQIEMPVIIANPFLTGVSIKPSINIEQLTIIAPALMQCFGLAMRYFKNGTY